MYWWMTGENYSKKEEETNQKSGKIQNENQSSRWQKWSQWIWLDEMVKRWA